MVLHSVLPSVYVLRELGTGVMSGVPRTPQPASATHGPALEGPHTSMAIVTTTCDHSVLGVIMSLTLGVLDGGRDAGACRHRTTPPRQEMKGFVS